MDYFIYHIPGKKIGVTCDLNKRVTLQQGYSIGEYEVLEKSEDIDYISHKELALQKAYGYKIDRQLYKHLKPNTKMKINITSQTTTFPCPVNKLKGRLMDNIGLTWETEGGALNVNKDTIPWIMNNVQVSMYNNDRSYVYNKAFHRAILSHKSLKEQDEVVKADSAINPSVYDLIREWASDKGIYEKGDSKTQYLKLMEESGELARAILKEDKPEVIDAIGDMVVVLTNLAHLEGLRIEDCVTSAYDVIKNRKGKMQNGTFVKEENLKTKVKTL